MTGGYFTDSACTLRAVKRYGVSCTPPKYYVETDVDGGASHVFHVGPPLSVYPYKLVQQDCFKDVTDPGEYFELGDELPLSTFATLPQALR